jgi:SSS family solute:Na+ symporter
MALVIDGLIILVYFSVIILIGLSMGRRDKSLHGLALGGRRVPWWAVMASIIAAETSAATFLGAPGEGFKARSIAYAQLVVGLILGRMFVGYVFLKPYYHYKVYTVYDYLAVRFGNRSKNYISALFLVMRTLASGARVFIPSLVMVLAWKLLSGKAQGGMTYSTEGTSLAPYVWAIVLLTVLTCLYTTVGGIRAVIWTDVVQASLMFGSALLAMVTILYHVGDGSILHGFSELGRIVPEVKTHQGYFYFGWEQSRVAAWMAEQAREGRHVTAMTAWEWVRLVFGSEFTLFSATLGAIFTNMGAFGTDQDMVQRLLTAETYQKSRRSLITAALMDVPIASGFAFIGVLLVAYFHKFPAFRPPDNSDVFGSYIINVMPPGIRGLVLAGVFATAMGSLSAALNALATSATNDWYIPYAARHRDESHHVAAARVFTVVFALLMILIALGSAYVKVTDPEFRIIPFVIGIAGIFLGPMLGVFLLGMLTRRRGSDMGNVVAITAALLAMFFLSGQHVRLMNIIYPVPRGDPPIYRLPHWLPAISWTWYAMVGAFITLAIGALFRTPPEALEMAQRRAAEAHAGQDKPLALR